MLGNGANDQLMLEKAQLGIAVLGFERASTRTIIAAIYSVSYCLYSCHRTIILHSFCCIQKEYLQNLVQFSFLM
ncbi:hypothetical protein SBF1_4290009 [Candidatus Desulfosporosinus infrequens]|uniref:Uncharacterized protein n=1 Tax=Candidatus Desulfosporosinus infrequens TaxID=2043169 RepID=A0A2U3LB27_9FIRM|nr:hypothetical protein SBF1_4290009 [Candidatus Desulfosporosinus infrequens]